MLGCENNLHGTRKTAPRKLKPGEQQLKKMRYVIIDKATGREHTATNECGLYRFANANRYEVRTEDGSPLPPEALRVLGIPALDVEPATSNLAVESGKTLEEMERELRIHRVKAEEALRIEENGIIRELAEKFPEAIRLQLEMAASRFAEAEEEQEAGNRFGASAIRQEAEERLLENLEAIGLHEVSQYMAIAMALV